MALHIGTSSELQKTISDQDIVRFAEAVGDNNPVHLDEEFAAKTIFKKRIAHGMLCGGLISAVIGTKLPGPGTIYLSQSMRFTAPVFIGDTVTAKVTVTKIKEGKGIYTLETVCHNQYGKNVVEGEAVVMFRG
jgi:3-hydroxybutyryl-CoA dehydratase